MIAKILPLFGTLILIASAYFSGAFAWDSYQNAVPDVARGSPISETAAAHPATAISLPKPRPDVYYVSITERPIFEPTRRPVPIAADTPALSPVIEETTPPGDEPAPFPEVSLLGVILSGSSSAALISVSGGSALWIKQGEYVDSWQLQKITEEQAEFIRDNQIELVDLYQ